MESDRLGLELWICLEIWGASPSLSHFHLQRGGKRI